MAETTMNNNTTLNKEHDYVEVVFLIAASWLTR